MNDLKNFYLATVPSKIIQASSNFKVRLWKINAKKVTFSDGNIIEWIYDAAGVKLTKIVDDISSGTTVTKDYVGGIEYNNNAEEAIYTSEGRAVSLTNGYRYEYSISDHLGNARVMFCDLENDGMLNEEDIIQREEYYPFGMVRQEVV